MPDIGNSNISSGRSETFEFTDTVPEDAERVEVTFEASLPNGTASTVTKSIDVLSLSDVIGASSISLDGTPVGGRSIEGTVTVRNDDEEQHDVTLLQNGNQIGSASVYSGRNRDVDFNYDLPQVSGSQSVDVSVDVQVNGEIVDTISKSTTVKEPAEFVSITGTDFPDSATSGQTISGRDAEVTVDSGIDDVTVNILESGNNIGSSDITRAGEDDVRVEIQMPDVESSKTITLNLEAVVGGTVADTSTQSIRVEGVTDNVSLTSLSAPSSMTSGEEAEISATVSNEFSESVTAELQYGGSTVASSSISDGRSSDLSFNYTAPTVEGSSTEKVSVDVVVNGTVADSESVTINVASPASKISIQSMAAPDGMVGGETAEIGTTVSNTGNTEYGVDLLYGGSVVDSSSIGGGRTSTLTFDYTAPQVETQQTVEPTVEVVVQGQSAGTSSSRITVRNIAEFVTIDNVEAPSEITSGKSGTVTTTVTNDYEERVDIALDYEGSIVTEGSVRANWSTDFDFVYNAPEVQSSQTDTIEVLAVVGETVASSATTTVNVVPKTDSGGGDSDSGDDSSSGGDTGSGGDNTDDRVIKNHIKVDTEQGTIRVDSEYDKAVAVSGSIRGTSIELSNGLSAQFSFLPGIVSRRLDGEIAPNSQNVVVEFSSIRNIDVETDRAFTWSIDGEKQETTRQFSKNLLLEQ